MTAFIPLPAQIGRIEQAIATAEAAGAPLIERDELAAIHASLRFLADNRDWIVPKWRARIDRDRAEVADHPAVAALVADMRHLQIAQVRPLSAEGYARLVEAAAGDDLSDITDPDSPTEDTTA